MMEPPAESEARAAITNAAETRSSTLRGLMQQHYESLHEIARRIHAGEAAGKAPSPTSLVHEAFVRLVDQPRISARGITFFRACFAQECRRILVDVARRRRSKKRGGDAIATIATTGLVAGHAEIDVLHLNDAIESLTRHNPRLGHVADMRLFGGMTVEECADALDLGKRTVVKDWSFAQQYLQKELR